MRSEKTKNVERKMKKDINPQKTMEKEKERKGEFT